MKILLLMMLLTFTTLVASNEGEFEGRFVIEKMIKDNSYISEKTDRFFTNGVWIFDTKTGSIQGCYFNHNLDEASYIAEEIEKDDKYRALLSPWPLSPKVICSDWSKGYED